MEKELYEYMVSITKEIKKVDRKSPEAPQILERLYEKFKVTGQLLEMVKGENNE